MSPNAPTTIGTPLRDLDHELEHDRLAWDRGHRILRRHTAVPQWHQDRALGMSIVPLVAAMFTAGAFALDEGQISSGYLMLVDAALLAGLCFSLITTKAPR